MLIADVDVVVIDEVDANDVDGLEEGQRTTLEDVLFANATYEEFSESRYFNFQINFKE